MDNRRILSSGVLGKNVVKDSLLIGLFAYYKLDESSGNAVDSGEYNYTLSQTNNPLGVVGKIGNARKFVSASSQYLSNSSMVLPDTDWTISAWVNIQTLTNFAHIINKWSGLSIGQMAAYINTNKIEFGIYNNSGLIGSTVTNTAFGNLSLNTWYHLILERNKTAGTIRIGINLIFDQSTANGVIGTTGLFRMGARAYTTSGFLNGTVDEVGIWTRLLTSTELTRLYNNSNGLSYPFKLTNNFVFEGDSETAGNGLSLIETWPFQISAKNSLDDFNGCKWTNLATSGNKITDILTQTASVDALFNSGYQNNVAILMAGVNDIALTEDSDETIHNNLSIWVAGRKLAGFTVVIMTIVGLSTAQAGGLNDLIRADYAGADILIDLALDSRLDDPTDDIYFQADNIHLSAAGALVVADLVREKLPK